MINIFNLFHSAELEEIRNQIFQSAAEKGFGQRNKSTSPSQIETPRKTGQGSGRQKNNGALTGTP